MSRLAACPRKPNCVYSDASGSVHGIAPLALAVPADEAWRVVEEVIESLPRTRIVDREHGYLHAECRTALLRFVDDLELELREAAGEIAVRSASRLGYSDLGANRARVEDLRSRLRERGVVS